MAAADLNRVLLARMLDLARFNVGRRGMNNSHAVQLGTFTLMFNLNLGRSEAWRGSQRCLLPSGEWRATPELMRRLDQMLVEEERHMRQGHRAHLLQGVPGALFSTPGFDWTLE